MINLDVMNIENLKEILFFCFLSFLTYYILILICMKYFNNLFGVCISNEKTSLFHNEIQRGLGVFFPLLILPIFMWENNFISVFDFLLLASTTLIGFWDDKKSLSQIFKVKLLLTFAFLIIFLDIYNNNQKLSELCFELIFKVMYFIFLVLFFNQIDGINGLASLTFISLVLLIIIMFKNLIFLLILGPIISYLFINLKGNIGIQGESGSFFMGTMIYILSKNSDIIYEKVLILFFLTPIICDVTATTIIRFFYKENIFLGHRNNLYQKLVQKYKNPTIISLSFSILQIIIGLFFYFLYITSDIFYYWHFIFVFVIALIFLVISFLIQKKFLFKD